MELLEICKTRVLPATPGLAHSMWDVPSSPFSLDLGFCRKAGLQSFEESLAYALVQLFQEMSFVVSDLPHAVLQPEIIEVPSNDGPPAHLIILSLDSTAAGSAISEGGSHSTHGGCSGEGSTALGSCLPAFFTYTPSSLFEVAQTLIYDSDIAADARAELFSELLGLFSDGDGAPGRDSKHPTLHADRSGLVSSFSLDTVSAVDGSGSSSRFIRLFSNIRSQLTHVVHEILTKTGLPFTSSPAVSAFAGNHGMDEEYRDGPHEVQPEGAGLGGTGFSARQPYLHLRLPPPLVLASHHRQLRNASLLSLVDGSTRTTSADC